MRQRRWPGVSDRFCLGGPPVARRAAPIGRPDQSSCARPPVFANAAQRSASSAESPRGQSRSRGDQDVHLTGTSTTRMQPSTADEEDYYRLRARRSGAGMALRTWLPSW
jgi:hypothetical protein